MFGVLGLVDSEFIATLKIPEFIGTNATNYVKPYATVINAGHHMPVRTDKRYATGVEKDMSMLLGAGLSRSISIDRQFGVRMARHYRLKS